MNLRYIVGIVYTVNIMRRTTENSARRAKSTRDEDLEKLKQVCAFLNLGKVPSLDFGPALTGQRFKTMDFTPFKLALRKLVKEWLDSGPNMELMVERNPSLWRKIEKVIIELQPTNTGAVKVDLAAMPREEELPRFDLFVHSFFLLLIMNRYWNRLGGPCARCDNYYIKKTSRQKVYCSKRCGLMETSISANRRRRLRMRMEKVEKAREFIAKWKTTRTKRNWKEWVSEKTRFKRTWLTRAVTSGDLDEPTERACESETRVA